MTALHHRPLLIVDDSDDDLFFARRAHRIAGLDAPLLCLVSGADLLAYQAEVADGRRPPPLAILLDINMPQLNGFAAYRQLRAAAGGPLAVPVWFLTGSDDPRDLDQARALGARGLITKPDSVRDLAQIFTELWTSLQAA